jgi:hypothetical protein
LRPPICSKKVAGIKDYSTLDCGIAPSPAPMRGSDQAIPTTKRDES